MLSITSQQQVEELKFIYGTATFTGKLTKLEPFEFQKNLWNSFQTNQKVCVSQCRQVGMTTLLLNLAFQRSKIESQKILFITHKHQQASHLKKYMSEFYKYEKESQGSSSANLKNIQFGIPSDLKGNSADLTILDNAAFYDFYNILFGGEIIISSCPQYTQDDFYKVCTDENWKLLRINFEGRPQWQVTSKEILDSIGQEAYNMEILGIFSDKTQVKIEETKIKEEKTISFRLPKQFLNLMEENMQTLELNQTDYFKFLIELYNKK